MCNPNKGLHKSYKKSVDFLKKASKKRVIKQEIKRTKEVKPNEAELYFLLNEDVLN